MNGELAQLAALVAHARVALATSEERLIPSLDNSTFQFVHAVRFERRRNRLLGPAIEPVASSPQEWYASLTLKGVSSLALTLWSRDSRLFPEYSLSAFSGGGTWGMRTVSGKRPSVWVAQWEPDNRNDPDNRIWSVVYREFAGSDAPVPRTSVDEAALELERRLTDAEVFARTADLDMWAEWFADARNKLHADAPSFEYHPDMLPATGYTPAARALLAGSERAWVFGGMGSWNDLGWDKDSDLDRRYGEVTPALYAAVLNGVAASVNSPLE